MLPEIEKGDYLVIHDTGAHGFAMGYNYNGKLKSAELLLNKSKELFFELTDELKTDRIFFSRYAQYLLRKMAKTY